jgi:hypothetical protein
MSNLASLSITADLLTAEINPIRSKFGGNFQKKEDIGRKKFVNNYDSKTTSLSVTMESSEKKQLDGSTAAPAPVRSSGIKVNSDPVESTTSISQSDPTHEAPETTFKVDKPPRSNKSDTSKLDHPDVAKSKTDSSELVNSQNSFPDSVYVGKRPVVYNNSRQGHMTKQHIKVSSQRVKSTNKTNDDVVSTPVTATVVTKETSKQRPHNLLGKYQYW